MGSGNVNFDVSGVSVVTECYASPLPFSNATSSAITVTATDGMTLPQLTGVVVFVVAVLVGCLLADALFRRW